MPINIHSDVWINCSKPLPFIAILQHEGLLFLVEPPHLDL